MTTPNGSFDMDWFDAAAVHAYRQGIRQDGEMSADRLACLMFLADMDSYWKHGKPITGATWVKGPRVPWPQEMGAGYLGGLVLSQGPWLRGHRMLREYAADPAGFWQRIETEAR